MQAIGQKERQWRQGHYARAVWAWRLHGKLIWGLFLGLAWGLPATGQPPLTLDPVVVTATVAPLSLSQTAASVTVIDRQQIDAQRAASVIDLLRSIPGVHIDQAGGRGSVSSVYIRGGDPNFTVVLLDGVKVNDPTNSRGGSFDFSTLNTDNIERIEIVRGPLSAVYGSDALSGVINIITRQGSTRDTRQVEVAGGRYAYWRTAAEARGRLGILDYAVSGSYLDNGEPIQGSEFTNGTGQANIGLAPLQNLELRWVLRYAHSDSEAFPEASGGPRFAVLREVDQRDIQELTLGMTLTHDPLPWWEYRLQVGIYNREEDIVSPGVVLNAETGNFRPPSQTDTSFWRYDVTLSQVFSVRQGIRLALGAQAQFEDGSSTGSQDLRVVGGELSPTNFELSRSIWAPFFEVQLSLLPGLLVQGSVRIDFPEGFDTEVSPRVGVSYTLAATGTTWRANWGEGFRLPSFFSLGSPLVGNPDLRPETSRSVDAGVTQTLWEKRVTIGATYFYNDFDDLIDFDFATFRLVNLRAVTTAGVEMSLQVRPWAVLGFAAHLTYVTTDIKGSTDTLRNRPQWRGGFTLHGRPWPALEMNLTALFVGETRDASIPTDTVTLDAYTRVDLAVNWTINATWLAFLTVDNLFDERYEEFVGFPAPGINPRLGIQARF
jgi:iron complex outermembrane receptor protein/vitamin B12 transporter